MSQTPQNTTPPAAAPNEQGVVHVEAFLRITDPKTQQVLVEQRA